LNGRRGRCTDEGERLIWSRALAAAAVWSSNTLGCVCMGGRRDEDAIDGDCWGLIIGGLGLGAYMYVVRSGWIHWACGRINAHRRETNYRGDFRTLNGMGMGKEGLTRIVVSHATREACSRLEPWEVDRIKFRCVVSPGVLQYM